MSAIVALSDRMWSWWSGLVFVGFTSLAAIGLFRIYRDTVLIVYPQAVNSAQPVIQLCVSITLILFGVFYARTLRYPFDKLYGIRLSSMRWYIIGVSLIVGLWLIYAYLFVQFAYSPYPFATSPLRNSVGNNGIVTNPTDFTSSFTIILLIPLLEEVMYRWILIDALRKLTLPIAAIVSSFVFAVGHGGIVEFGVALIVSFVFVFVRIGSGSVLPSYASHVTHNLIVAAFPIMMRWWLFERTFMR